MPKQVVPRTSGGERPSARLLGLAFVLAACAAAYGVGLRRASDAAAATATSFRTGSLGPWGQLELLRTEIEPPPSLITSLQGNVPPWFFPGHSRDGVLALLARAGIAREALATLPADAWLPRPDGVALRVPLPMVMDLSRSAREAIYPVLAQSRENLSHHEPLIMVEAHLDERLRTSGLSADVQQTFRRLLYRSRGELVFADYLPMLAWLRDDAARLRFSATLVRKSTLLARLRIGPASDLDAIVRYWNAGRRAEPMRPLLEALARVPGGADIGIENLLPPFARRRLFTYPDPHRPSELMGDCFWSALNFFNDAPDARFHDLTVVRETLERDYRSVEGAPRFGDLVVLFAERDRSPVHAAVYVADGVVFTKNGGALVQPWVLTEQAQMERHYAYWSGPLAKRVLRRSP